MRPGFGGLKLRRLEDMRLKPADIDIEVDSHFDKLNHRFQRVAWVLMAAFLVAAAAGLFGQSRFAFKKVIVGAATLHYSQFVRKEAPSELKLEVANATEIVRVWISNKYLDTLQIDSVNPVPTENISKGDGVEYLFKSQGGTLSVVFEMTPQNFGSLEGEFSVNDSAKQTFSQFSYF